MAEGERRLFSHSGIFQLLLFISCAFATQSSEIDPVYQLLGGHDTWTSTNLVVRHRPSREKRAADAVTQPTTVPHSPTGPDAVTNGNGNQTLPDSPNQSGSNSGPTVVNVTESNNPIVTTQPTSVDNSSMSTTPENPFKEADIIHDYHDYYSTKALKESIENYYTEIGTATKHETLSKSHRVAAVIPLKFDFLFYGHPVKSITVATGGFIYMSPFLHQWLTATQYIAPLMANFDLSSTSDSNIYYLSEVDMFTVEWRNVILQDQPTLGKFTFQASLYSNGSISFVYKEVPVHVVKISDDLHPVKVGLSDAFYNDTYYPQYGYRRRVIHEYHQVVLKFGLVRSGAVIFINPLPTCNLLEDCESCTNHVDVKFDCHWCNVIGRCSDGLDWYRQHWDKYGCKQYSFDVAASCTATTTPKGTTTARITTRGSTTTPKTHVSTAMTKPTTTLPTTTTTTPHPTTTTTPHPTTTTTPHPTTTTTPHPTTTTTPHPTTTTTPHPTTTTTPHPTTTTTPHPTTTTTPHPTTTPTTTTTTPHPTTTPTTTTTTPHPTTTPTTTTTTPHPTTTPTTTTTTPHPTTTPTTTTTAKTASVKSTESSTSETDVLIPVAGRSKSGGGICDSKNQTNECADLPPPEHPVVNPIPSGTGAVKKKKCADGNCGDGSKTPVAVIVVTVLLVLALVCGVSGWVYYAYTHPTSRSGMWLMEHRPSQLKAKIKFWKSSSSSDQGAKYRAEADA